MFPSFFFDPAFGDGYFSVGETVQSPVFERMLTILGIGSPLPEETSTPGSWHGLCLILDMIFIDESPDKIPTQGECYFQI